jgi:hypothetical protein
VSAHLAEQLTVSLEQTTIISLDDVLSKVTDHYNSMKTIRPAKCNPSVDKKIEGKDKKEKGNKSAAANPVISNSAISSRKCQEEKISAFMQTE